MIQKPKLLADPISLLPRHQRKYYQPRPRQHRGVVAALLTVVVMICVLTVVMLASIH